MANYAIRTKEKGKKVWVIQEKVFASALMYDNYMVNYMGFIC